VSEDWRSLLVFQYFPRKKRALYINRMIDEARRQIPLCEVVAFLTSDVLYLLIVQRKHVDRLSGCVSAVERQWGETIRVLSEGTA
jgi:hypothetical protein